MSYLLKATLLTTLLLLPAPAILSPPTTNYTSPLPPFIPFASLATAYPNSLLAQNPIYELQIRNTLAHYPLAIDGKNFSALDLVFAPDVVANYSPPLGVVTGLENVMKVLESALEKVTSQHALSTTVVEILDGGRAKTLSYLTANQFGTGVYTGQVSWVFCLKYLACLCPLLVSEFLVVKIFFLFPSFFSFHLLCPTEKQQGTY